MVAESHLGARGVDIRDMPCPASATAYYALDCATNYLV
jgi:hypothetical protein